jgi:hypothetical protein
MTRRCVRHPRRGRLYRGRERSIEIVGNELRLFDEVGEVVESSNSSSCLSLSMGGNAGRG